ncbi:GvpL/GvpF family gas vesicle protein [Streptomyces sp. NPDC014773]|uniref:GvpL/GvpF family gas vesicle protein n=1 Tax=Streptomyces sp. NPDC014773 TaxID=3364908 RepID=UPI0036F78E33
MNGEQTPTYVYVYAVAAPAPRLPALLPGVHGVEDAPVTLLAPLDAAPGAPAFVTSRVPATHWSEDVLRTRFEDLAWLEGTARAHHHVVEVLAAHTTVLPLRIATLYRDDDRALAALREQRPAFAERLALFARHTEYGVKAYVAPDPPDPPGPGAPAPEAGTGTASPAPPSPGKAYLQARRAQHHAREDRYRQAGRAAERIAATAARYATRAVRHPAQTGPLGRGERGERGENVLNDAYLVPDDLADAFRTAVMETVRDLPGVRVEVTGPWAPYSFATLPVPPAPTGTAETPGPRP